MASSKQFPFETIVVATDFSENSSATLRYAQAIAVCMAPHWFWCTSSIPSAMHFPKECRVRSPRTTQFAKS